MGQDIYVLVSVIDADELPGDPDTLAQEAISDLIQRFEQAGRLTECNSRWGWIQSAIWEAATNIGITSLDFLLTEEVGAVRPTLHRLCQTRLTDALDGITQLMAYIQSAPDDSEVDPAALLEGRDALDAARPVKRINDHDTDYPVSSFLKALRNAMNEAVTSRRCVLYVAIL